jgi:hypothetical protein
VQWPPRPPRLPPASTSAAAAAAAAATAAWGAIIRRLCWPEHPQALKRGFHLEAATGMTGNGVVAAGPELAAEAGAGDGIESSGSEEGEEEEEEEEEGSMGRGAFATAARLAGDADLMSMLLPSQT